MTFWATISLGAIAVGLERLVGGDRRSGTGSRTRDPKVLVADRKRLARLEGVDPGVPDDRDRGRVRRALGLRPRRGAARRADRGGRPRGHPLHERHDRSAEGRGQHASQHRGRARVVVLPRRADGDPRPPDRRPTRCPIVPARHVAAVPRVGSAHDRDRVSGRRRALGLDRRPVRPEERSCSSSRPSRITHWSYTPTMLHRSCSHPAARRVRPQSLRSGGGGGATFSPALLERRAKEALPNLGSSMGVGYGQTECAALATLNAGEELNRFPESAGRPLPTVQLVIRDPDGSAPPGGRGRRDPRAGTDGDAGLLAPARGDGRGDRLPGGWLRTGDIGRLEGGRLYLASRKRDLILRGGENVYPVEIENRLEDHPDVAEVAVIGVDARRARAGGARRSWCRSPGVDLMPRSSARSAPRRSSYYKVPAHWEHPDGAVAAQRVRARS